MTARGATTPNKIHLVGSMGLNLIKKPFQNIMYDQIIHESSMKENAGGRSMEIAVTYKLQPGKLRFHNL